MRLSLLVYSVLVRTFTTVVDPVPRQHDSAQSGVQMSHVLGVA